TSTGGATWTAHSSSTTQDLRAVAFADAAHGWAVGAGGTVVATSTAGATWATQASGSTRDLAGVAFADPAHGWVVGAGGAVLSTGNGGATWAAQSSGTTKDLVGVAFADAEHGGIAGAGGTILATSDAGILDSTPPRTSAKGLQARSSSGWRNTSQTVTLQAHDAGSGPAATYYTLDGGARQTYSAPFPVSSAGSHLVRYWSVDWAGNVEAKHAGYVNIDLGKPVCVAIGNVKTYSGTSAAFRFRVNDPKPSCGFANTSITIYKNGKAKKRFKLYRVTVNKAHTHAYRLTLPAGAYTWTVTATDIAGNTQVKAGTAKLKVLAMPLPTIANVQRRLVALHYLPSSAVSGKSDYRTSQALTAFQAWNGLPRDGVAGVQTRTKLLSASIPHPRAGSAYGHYVEVYRSLGVVLCVDSGTVVRVVHCSTGRPGLETTPGVWHVYLKSLRFYSQEYDSWMPWTSFFHGGEGLHGYEEVPAYPASHGCVRLSMPEAPWVYDFATMGTTVYVY
ncbi:MAG TPA: L,D-transpeptidase family protein, partial [Thermoleophilia bacterium]|nr:L,D-transpeptidase family protein [Thermoleophilia bacterium]